MKEIIIEEKLLGDMYSQEVRGELIRCKDCKNAEILAWLDNVIICKKHNYTGVRPEEFYCADGERKEGR